jgi:hypothetical protein
MRERERERERGRGREREGEGEEERERESEREKERERARWIKLNNVCTVALTNAADAQCGIEQCLYCSLDDSIYTKNNGKTLRVIKSIRIYGEPNGCGASA